MKLFGESLVARLQGSLGVKERREVLRRLATGEAKMIIGDIDEEDIAFIACALTIEDSIIWSDDKHFEKHAQILTLKTTDIVEMLKED